MIEATTLYVLVVLFIATVIRSAFGFGEALIAVPLLALRINITVAAPLAVLVSVTVAAVVVAQDWRKVHVRSAGGLVLATLLGIPLGLLVLKSVNDHIVKVVLGSLLVLFACYSLLGKKRLHLEKDHPGMLLTCGFLAGVLGGAYGMNSPPLVVYGSLRRWSPQHFRATLQAYFLPASTLVLVGYGLGGLWSYSVTRYYLLALPLNILGIIIGRAINRRLRGDAFLKYIYAALIVTGVALLAQSMRPGV